MIIFGLLIIPVIVGLVGLAIGKGKITWKEFLAHEAIMVLLIVIGYYFALQGKMADTEIWNGVIAKKWEGSEHCCHSYPCNCRLVCDSERNCHEECDTCYQHFSDDYFKAVTSNGETAYYNGCNPPGSRVPRRWQEIVVGEPTAIKHKYTNYIKGNPDSILRRQGTAEKFVNLLPRYPAVYDHYRADRFLTAGLDIPNAGSFNRRLSEINAKLGALKEINIIVLAVKTGDQMYLEGLREHWLGGKKNDLITVVGIQEFPKISWAGVLSWTKNENVKIGIRDRIMELSVFDGNEILNIVSEEADKKFIRRPMEDFEYLKSTIEPPRWACWTLFIAGCFVSVGLQYYFWKEDPFEDGHTSYRFRSYFNRF